MCADSHNLLTSGRVLGNRILHQFPISGVVMLLANRLNWTGIEQF